MPKVITRTAPSPTGKLHVGGLRSALYNYLFARHHGGKFYVRIEDTDQTRLVPQATQDILESLRWAGLTWDNEPMVQSRRLEIYAKAADQLITGNHAFRCFCTTQRLEQLRHEQASAKLPTHYDGHCKNLSAEQSAKRHEAGEPSVVRFAIPARKRIEFTDLIRGNVQVNADTLDDYVLLKSDGFPTYHLASVVDDQEMGVTHIIRGDEWLPSAPKHILLYQAFGWTPPEFAHLPLVLNPDRTKMSKRAGDVAVSDYRSKGYLPEALVNFVLLLGWNPKTDEELFTLDEMIQRFDLPGVNKAGAIFNIEKLDWMNGVYLRQLSAEAFTDRAWPFLEAAGLVNKGSDRAQVAHWITLEQPRIKRLLDLPDLVGYLFKAPKLESILLVWKKQSPMEAREMLTWVRSILDGIADNQWTAQHLETLIKEAIAQKGVANGLVLWPFRVALSGRKDSPPPFAIASALGKPETIRRVDQAISSL